MTKAYKTVFILGAGASRDFGFPTGEELLKDIVKVCDACIKDCEDRRKMRPSDYERRSMSLLNHFTDFLWTHYLRDRKKLESLAERLKNGLPLSKSIDNFLNDQTNDLEFQNFGKLIISAALLLRESGSHELSSLTNLPNSIARSGLNGVDFFDLRKTWFVTFFRELRTDNGKTEAGLDGFKKRLDEIAVITFNYERSFEFLMRQAISQYQAGIEVDDIRDVMSHLTIIHPYGDLGNFEELPYGTPLSAVKNWSDFQTRIQIFTELANQNKKTDNTDNALKQKLLDTHKVIAKAKKLVFLGFGFHEQNMEFLGFTPNYLKYGYFEEIDDFPIILKIYATAFGMSDYQRNVQRVRLMNLLYRARLETIVPPKKSTMQEVQQVNNVLGSPSEGPIEDPIEENVIIENATCRDILDEYVEDIFEFESDKPPSDKDLFAPVY